MAHQLLSTIALPNSGFSQTSSSLLIATEFQLGQLPDFSLKGVTPLLTLSGHVTSQTSTVYGQGYQLSVLSPSLRASKYHTAHRPQSLRLTSMPIAKILHSHTHSNLLALMSTLGHFSPQPFRHITLRHYRRKTLASPGPAFSQLIHHSHISFSLPICQILTSSTCPHTSLSLTTTKTSRPLPKLRTHIHSGPLALTLKEYCCHNYLQQRITQHIIKRLLLIKDLLQIYSSSTLSETNLLGALMPIATSLEPHTRRKTNCSQPQSLRSEDTKAYCFATETMSDTTLGKQPICFQLARLPLMSTRVEETVKAITAPDAGYSLIAG